MPKARAEVCHSKIDFSAFTEFNILEKTVRPWVSQKIKVLLGVEEQSMIRLVMTNLATGSATFESILGKVEAILDEDSEEFCFKLWQVLLFEDLQIKDGVY